MVATESRKDWSMLTGLATGSVVCVDIVLIVGIQKEMLHKGLPWRS